MIKGEETVLNCLLVESRTTDLVQAITSNNKTFEKLLCDTLLFYIVILYFICCFIRTCFIFIYWFQIKSLLQRLWVNIGDVDICALWNLYVCTCILPDKQNTWREKTHLLLLVIFKRHIFTLLSDSHYCSHIHTCICISQNWALLSFPLFVFSISWFGWFFFQDQRNFRKSQRRCFYSLPPPTESLDQSADPAGSTASWELSFLQEPSFSFSTLPFLPSHFGSHTSPGAPHPLIVTMPFEWIHGTHAEFDMTDFKDGGGVTEGMINVWKSLMSVFSFFWPNCYATHTRLSLNLHLLLSLSPEPVQSWEAITDKCYTV